MNGAITNLSANSTRKITDFEVGQGFSGVFAENTGISAMYPSSKDGMNIKYADGTDVPLTERVRRIGGHREVDRNLTGAIGLTGGKRVGFAAINHGDTIEVMFNSRTINNPNFGNRTAPEQYQDMVIESLKAEFGATHKII